MVPVIEAEQATLGSCLIDPYAIVRVMSLVGVEDFALACHQALYQTFLDLYAAGTPTDAITVHDALTTNGRDAGGQDYWLRFTLDTPTSINAEHYAIITRRAALKRRLEEAGMALAHSASLPESDPASIAAETALALTKLEVRAQPNEGIRHMSSVAKQYGASVLDKNADVGLSTGLVALDQMLMGMRGGDLIIVAARTSLGKSSLCLSIARHLAIEHKHPMCYFSLEQSMPTIHSRLLMQLTRIDSAAMRRKDFTEQQRTDLTNAEMRLSESTLYLRRAPAIQLDNLVAEARAWKQKVNGELIVVDHLQLVRTKGENRTREVSEVSMALKALALELDVPIIAPAQLSRAHPSHRSEAPRLEDLKESSSLEQDADVVLILHRSSEDMPTPADGPTDVFVAKNRDLDTGKLRLHFNGALMEFRDEEWRSDRQPESRMRARGSPGNSLKRIDDNTMAF